MDVWRLIRGILGAAAAMLLMVRQPLPAVAYEESGTGARADSRYCTLWFESGIELKKINKKISTRFVKSYSKIPKGMGPDSELAAKCDVLFRRAQELLDMYPAGIHVTVRVVAKQDHIDQMHRSRYGHGVEAPGVYVYENNTIYVSAKDLSESVLVHEMAHAIIDHFFGVRPPRKVEELLAMYVDEHLRD